MLPMFLAVVDQTIIATALPAIVAATGEVERASWIVVSYLIAATIAAPVYGRLGDSFGRRRIMYFALAIFMVASVLCAASTTILTLTLARVLQGLGGGGLMTLSQALIGESIPPRERARYQGYLAAVAVCANSFGPIAGGFLTEHFGWQSIFLVNLPIGLFAFYLVTRLPPPHGERLAWRADPGGAILFAIFVATTLLALEQVQRADLANLPIGAALLAAGVIALVILVWHENRAASPLIPLSLLRQSAIWHSDAMAACHGAALVSLITFLPVYLEVVRGFSPSATGLVLVPLTVGIGVGSLVTGRLVNITGRLMIYPVVGLFIATLDFMVLSLFGDRFDIVALAILLLVNGLAMGTVMGVVQVSVQNAAGQLRLGEAAASVQFSRSIGAAFGTALVATLLFAVLSLRNPDSARVFAAMFEHAKHAGAGLSVSQLSEIQGDITVAFRAAFMAMALFTTCGFFLSITNPQKRI
ncbi:MFS transporter [Undibacter mobilis]|uniref:MFS transporter n=2 Tax=Undibacter mobilis TaxID=2292256 RepID=A0A371BEC5_9BRAD|nr:MFS transporter [Undibacter mobilis]